MVDHILSSNQKAIVDIRDLWMENLLIPSFDFQELTTMKTDEKYALSVWIQIICLYEINNQEYVHECSIETVVDTINKALESEDFNVILNCRSHIRSLYSQIHRDWTVQHSLTHYGDSLAITTSQVVYRTENISIDELNFLETNVGNKLILNKFLLLNENKDVVSNNTNNDPDMKSVLFQITIDRKLTTKPYVKLPNESLLIAPCATYFVQSLIYDSQNNLWLIKLHLCTQNDSDLQKYLEFLLEKDYITDSYVFGFTLYLFEKYHLAIDFLFQRLNLYSKIDYGYVGLLQLLSDVVLDAYVDNISYSLFILHLTTKTCIQFRVVHNVDSVLVHVYLTLGNIYRRQKSFQKALSYYKKSKDKIKSGTSSAQYSMQIFLNMNYVYEMMNKYMDAQNGYHIFSNYLTELISISKTDFIFKKQAKNLARIQYKIFFSQLKRLEHRYETDSVMIMCEPKSSSTSVLRKMTNFSEIAYRNLYKLLVKYYYRSTTFDFRTIAELYSAISRQYAQDRNFSYSINTRKMAMKIRSNNLLSPTNSLLMDYYSIATYYYLYYKNMKEINQKHLQLADYYIKKTIQMSEKIFPNDHIFQGESYNVQAVIFVHFGQYDLALTYFKKALSIYSNWINSNNQKFGFIYKSIGIVYLRKKDYLTAIEYFQRVLINRNNIKQSKVFILIQISKLLIVAYYHLHEKNKALEQMKNLINIYREYILNKDDPAIEIFNYFIEDDRSLTFDQLYQKIARFIHLNYDQTVYEPKFHLDYQLASAYNINVPLHICVYDEYLFNTDVYFLSLNDTNEDILLVNQIRHYSQNKYFICYKDFNTIDDLCQYIQLIIREDEETTRSVALIIPKRFIAAILSHQIPKHQTAELFCIDESCATDSCLQQLVNLIDERLLLQFRAFKQLIQCTDLDDTNTNQNAVKYDDDDGITNAEVSVINDTSTTTLVAQTADPLAMPSMKEELEIIWFSENIEEADNSRLLEAFDCIRIINDSSQCIQMISSLTVDQKLFLILTDENGLNLSETLKNKCIHIYLVNIHHPQLKDRTIFHNIFETFDQLIRQLRIDIRMTSEDRLQFNIFTSTAQSIQQLDKESAEFIWFHALIDAMQYDKEQQMKSKSWYTIEKNQMLNKCRLECNMNNTTLRKIDTFQETYRESDAIKWYAEDTFVYRFINKALRSNNIEEIIQYRFFIADLHNQLKVLCEEQFCEMNTVVTVYRGQGLSTNDFNSLKKNIANLITIKSFLSTSLDRDVALNFVITQIDVPGIEPVLFEMKLDTNLRQKPFAFISEFTPMNENEVLLSMGFVFRIKLVQFDRIEKFWIVELILESETDQIKELLSYTKETESQLGLQHVLYGMGEYNAALRYCQWFIDKSDSNNQTLVRYYIEMATIYKELQEYDSALVSIGKSSLTVFEKAHCQSFNYEIYLSDFYYTLGLIYLGKGNYHIAIYIFHMLLEQTKVFANELLSVTKDVTSQDDWEWLTSRMKYPDAIGKVWNNLGFAYTQLKQYRAAYHYLSKGLELYRKYLPKKHYELSIIYRNFGYFYKDIMDYENALNYLTKAIHVLKLSRNAKHFSVFCVYRQIAELYEIKYDYSMALENYQNAYNHATEISTIIEQTMNIARSYNKTKQYEQAIEMSERAARLCREYSLPMTYLFKKKDNVMLYR